MRDGGSEQQLNTGALATGECLDRRPSSITGRRPDNCRAPAALRKDMVHQPGEKLTNRAQVGAMYMPATGGER